MHFNIIEWGGKLFFAPLFLNKMVVQQNRLFHFS
jgi:hypothetical protein